jgi:NAD(P)-dependent dehydrogenase (short-subunit alcohol dehydrogenase family)
MRFNDKAVIVTGGGRAIGREICHRFAREGARVLIADIDGANARSVAEEIRGVRGRAEPFTFDMTVPAQVEAMVAHCEATFGGVDVLVNNASIGHAQYVLDITPEEWEHVIRTDLTGPFYCAQAAGRRMVRAGKGKIINLASISGERGGTGRAAYGAAKAGLELLTKVMAVELAEKGVHVNAVSPGPVDTPQSRATHNPETRAAYLGLLPSHRYGEPTEIASAVLFLASDEASWIHGAILHVDGGFAAAGLMVKLG